MFECIECKKKCEAETDIQLCNTCMEKYDTERLWKEHDLNKVDALDFNESEVFRKKYLIHKCPGCSNIMKQIKISEDGETGWYCDVETCEYDVVK